MTFHHLLVYTGGAFLAAAVILDLRHGGIGIIAAAAGSVALVVGYKLAEAFSKGGWS